MNWAELADRVLPILAFVVAITVVAELADRIGVFRLISDVAARWARGSVVVLWLGVVVVAVLATAVLSLDTTAVLLTPVVLALAHRLHLDETLFAFTAVWLANTASLFLPVSNLTNLLALHPLDRLQPGTGPLDFLRLYGPAAATAVLITVGVLAVLFHRTLRGRYVLAPVEPPRDRVLLRIGLVVCALLGPAFLVGLEVWQVATVAAVVLVAACAWRGRRDLLRWSLLPWPLVLGVSVLFVVVQLAHEHGLSALVVQSVGQGSGGGELLRVAGVGALGANVLNNLPAYLALEPAVTDAVARLGALLVGVNAGPLLTPWASLATLLWAARCRTAGVSVSWWGFAARGALLVPLVLLGTVGVLSWTVPS